MGYILEEKLLIDVANSQSSRGSKIVFTHGAFDLFHVGHLELIKRSLKFGDLMIVGVESDERIHKYKNSYRPVVKHAERLKVIAHLNCVDFVLPIVGKFDKDYYFKLYLKLNVHVLTHGIMFGVPKDQLNKRSREAYVGGMQIRRIRHKFEYVTTTKIIDSILKTGDALLYNPT